MSSLEHQAMSNDSSRMQIRINRPLDELVSKRRVTRQGRRNAPVSSRPVRGRLGARKTGGRQAQHGASLEEIISAGSQNITLKVSNSSTAQGIAGAIAHTIRETDQCPTLLAGGVACVNTATKAIAIARNYLADDEQVVDIIAVPEFEGDTARATFTLTKARPITLASDAVELTVKGHSDPYKVAGAIAGKVREGERVSLVAVGPEAVFHAIEALAVSREYLEEDQVDVKFCPEFTTVEDGDRTSTGLFLGVLARQY